MAQVATKMSENGRITFPLGVRAEAGLERGGSVIVEVIDGELHVRSVARAMERARALSRGILSGKKGVSVDDFLAERRREAKREG
jgi:bifunctional DNA-binding transcriptional regulator/antitoxin component of YhaV-PrlF toxin-antitoxin module